jgi:hypothetical protein
MISMDYWQRIRQAMAKGTLGKEAWIVPGTAGAITQDGNPDINHYWAAGESCVLRGIVNHTAVLIP